MTDSSVKNPVKDFLSKTYIAQRLDDITFATPSYRAKLVPLKDPAPTLIWNQQDNLLEGYLDMGKMVPIDPRLREVATQFLKENSKIQDPYNLIGRRRK